MSDTRGWYIIHVFSGYEQKIERQILNLIETNTFFANNCYGVKVPIQKRTEVRDGKPKIVNHKLMPGYVLVDLNLPRKVAGQPWTLEDEDKQKKIISMLRGINGVTGLIGNTTARDAQPQPLTQAEYNKILVKIGEMKDERTVHATFDYNVGDSVKIITGPFSGFKGTVSEILGQHNKLKVTVEIFGRPTLVEVDAMATEKNI